MVMLLLTNYSYCSAIINDQGLFIKQPPGPTFPLQSTWPTYGNMRSCLGPIRRVTSPYGLYTYVLRTMLT